MGLILLISKYIGKYLVWTVDSTSAQHRWDERTCVAELAMSDARGILLVGRQVGRFSICLGQNGPSSAWNMLKSRIWSPHLSTFSKSNSKTILGGSSHLYSKWVSSPQLYISRLTLLIPFVTGIITHLLSGMSHQWDTASTAGHRSNLGGRWTGGEPVNQVNHVI